MAYKHYLLGCLIDKPMSGYSLHKHLFAPFRRPLSQIYRTLTKMSEEGLVEVERVVQEKLPSQNVYSITEAGRAELMRWLRQQETVNVSHIEVLGRLWLGSRLEKNDVVKHLESFTKHVQEQLNYFRVKAKPLVEARAKERGYTVDDVYQLLIVDYGIRQYEVALEWASDAFKKIDGLMVEDTKVGVAGTEREKDAQELISASLEHEQ